jgi:hypothetical protein
MTSHHVITTLKTTLIYLNIHFYIIIIGQFTLILEIKGNKTAKRRGLNRCVEAKNMKNA